MWCSIETITLVKAEVLPAPAMLNKFGKPAVMRSEVVEGPDAPLVWIPARPPKPFSARRMSVPLRRQIGGEHQRVERIFRPPATTPRGVIRSISWSFRSTSRTCGWLKISMIISTAVDTQAFAADGLSGREA